MLTLKKALAFNRLAEFIEQEEIRAPPILPLSTPINYRKASPGSCGPGSVEALDVVNFAS